MHHRSIDPYYGLCLFIVSIRVSSVMCLRDMFFDARVNMCTQSVVEWCGQKICRRGTAQRGWKMEVLKDFLRHVIVADSECFSDSSDTRRVYTCRVGATTH